MKSALLIGSGSRRASGLRLSLLAWLPLVAALSVAAGLARTVCPAALVGRGGSFSMPAEAVVSAPVAARVFHVRRPRAPDAPESSRAI